MRQIIIWKLNIE